MEADTEAGTAANLPVLGSDLSLPLGLASVAGAASVTAAALEAGTELNGVLPESDPLA